MLPGLAAGQADAQFNPISRAARLFHPRLVAMEDRIHWLENRLGGMAAYREHAMKSSLGYRGGRLSADGPDPSVIIDLPRSMEIQEMFLVPAQREFLEDPGLFPVRFTIELSETPDFRQRMVLFSTSTHDYPAPQGRPVRIFGNDARAKHLRLTVHRGHSRSFPDTFALSEWVVLADGHPISFGAEVRTSGALDSPGIWQPSALTDGRMPHGIWQGGRRAPERGETVVVVRHDQEISWSINLGTARPLDHMILYPHQLTANADSAVLPELLEFSFFGENGQPSAPSVSWQHPHPGGSHQTPAVIPLREVTAARVQLRATRPWSVGDFRVHALSEWELWSQGENLAAGLPVLRRAPEGEENVFSLTDGYSSEANLIPVGAWLGQLHDRLAHEREIEYLRPQYRSLLADSELHTTWGGAILLGLSFLFPVFFLERRRARAKEQVEILRKRIASDLHDDIGSNLGSISMIARSARKDLVRLQGPEEIAEDLTEVESIARESSLAMRDIVWLLERRQDTIGDLVQRMREIASRLLREVKYELTCDSDKTAAKLNLDAKRHLFLFFKEAVHNIHKHAQAQCAAIRLWDEGDFLLLEISDDGIGLPEGPDRKPAVIRKIEERARVMSGTVEIESATGQGTRVRLRVRRSHLTQNHPNS